MKKQPQTVSLKRDENDKIVTVPDPNGKFIAGIDPYSLINEMPSSDYSTDQSTEVSRKACEDYLNDNSDKFDYHEANGFKYHFRKVPEFDDVNKINFYTGVILPKYDVDTEISKTDNQDDLNP